MAIADGVKQLHELHEEQIMQYLEDSEEKIITVNYAVEIDCSEDQRIVMVRQRFSQSVTDKRVARIEDPSQTTFVFVRPDEFDQKQLALEDPDIGKENADES